MVLGKPENQWSWPPWNGSLGLTTKDFWNPLVMFLQQNMKHTITSSKSSANSSKARWVRVSTLLKPNDLYETRGGSGVHAYRATFNAPNTSAFHFLRCDNVSQSFNGSLSHHCARVCIGIIKITTTWLPREVDTHELIVLISHCAGHTARQLE